TVTIAFSGSLFAASPLLTTSTAFTVIVGCADFSSNGATTLVVLLSADVFPDTSVVCALTSVLSANLSLRIVTLTLPFSVVG
ncbi:hypothetical protein, partial [Glaesserella parasuis]|uniref:hypothetical protein n=1 Tax=Glaesserella parasuis TaxID=738 RepID=UPI002436A874